jgi:hypothetical protein
MRDFARRDAVAAALALLAAGPGAAQPEPGRRDIRLPDGKSQREEILKADHEQNLKDAAALVELGLALERELEKNARHVLSVSSIRKTEEIEKLAKRIRGRLRRF